MAERPDLTGNPSRVEQLAERFGMTKESVEELLRSTKESYANPPAAAVLPPAEATERTPIEAAAAELPAVPPTPNKTTTNAAPPRRGPSSGLLVALLVLLLIALGLAVSFQRGCFRQRKERAAASQVDTIQNILSNAAKNASTPPQPPSNVPSNEVPPEALVVPREEPPGTSGTPSSSGITSESQVESSNAPVLETSSNLAAEERLAELRANGNTHARMKTSRRHGSTIYRVYAQ